jgi:uncharacterized membrane protein YhaH (DUF805 family)
MISTFIGSLGKYVDFSGRATRKEFWTFVFFYYFFTIVGVLLDALYGTDFISNLLVVGIILPYISCAARRMHDVGKSGWFMLVPVYNLILFFSASIPEKSE